MTQAATGSGWAWQRMAPTICDVIGADGKAVDPHGDAMHDQTVTATRQKGQGRVVGQRTGSSCCFAQPPAPQNAALAAPVKQTPGSRATGLKASAHSQPGVICGKETAGAVSGEGGAVLSIVPWPAALLRNALCWVNCVELTAVCCIPARTPACRGICAAATQNHAPAQAIAPSRGRSVVQWGKLRLVGELGALIAP